MGAQFERTIGELWRALGMEPPRLSPDNRTILQVDGAPIELREAPDAEHMLIVATAGALARDQRRRDEQVGDLLRANLANAPQFSVCVSLLDPQAETPWVVVEGRYAYRDRNIEKLAAQIQQVAQLRGAHGARLADDASPSRPSALSGMDAEATIFRP